MFSNMFAAPQAPTGGTPRRKFATGIDFVNKIVYNINIIIKLTA